MAVKKAVQLVHTMAVRLAAWKAAWKEWTTVALLVCLSVDQKEVKKVEWTADRLD